MILRSLLVSATLCSPAFAQHDALLEALCKVESNCDPDAVGDGGKAIGPYQIWEVYWLDAVEFDPDLGGSYHDCLNKEYAEKVVRAYWARYANERRLGRPVTDEDRARIHNGGPNGHKKKATLKYWKKVKDVLITSISPSRER